MAALRAANSCGHHFGSSGSGASKVQSFDHLQATWARRRRLALAGGDHRAEVSVYAQGVRCQIAWRAQLIVPAVFSPAFQLRLVQYRPCNVIALPWPLMST